MEEGKTANRFQPLVSGIFLAHVIFRSPRVVFFFVVATLSSEVTEKEQEPEKSLTKRAVQPGYSEQLKASSGPSWTSGTTDNVHPPEENPETELPKG